MTHKAGRREEVQASTGMQVHPKHVSLPATPRKAGVPRHREGKEDKGPAPLAHGPFRAIQNLGRPIGVRTEASKADATGLTIVQNVDLSPGFEVWETCAASASNTVLYTGNWFAAYSVDSGNTFTPIDPAE